MKTLRRISLLILVLFVVLSGCSPDSEAPVQAGQSPDIAMQYHNLGPFCSESQRFRIVDDAGDALAPGGIPYGELAMDYNMDSTYFALTLAPGWFIEKAAWYVGHINNVPLTQNGLISTNSFTENFDPATYVNNYTFRSGFVYNGFACYDAVFWCEAVMVDFFQGPINSTRRNLWAAQAPFSNGFMIETCYQPCQLR